jgi:dTDP-4-dehydrorhamnose 3,5-epimerase
MKFTKTSIPEVIKIEPKLFSDKRGFFKETYQKIRYKEAGIVDDFVQINHSGSKQNVLRGIHYQIRHPQGKLVRVVRGAIFDVAVDLRKSSPTFGKYVGEMLSEENHRQLWIPPGFGHGFFVLSDWAEIIYLATDFYSPESERTILWNDLELGIDWPSGTGGELIVSDKDQKGVRFCDAEVYN